jgi:hypothetical protein
MKFSVCDLFSIYATSPPKFPYTIVILPFLNTLFKDYPIQRLPYSKITLFKDYPIQRIPYSKITPLSLFSFNSLKQTLEIPRSKPIETIPLDDLQKDRWSIHQRLSEQLQ